ncbi:HCP-like protein [Polychaeton citri CBS 116435]|uniref:HCP-like protein n=1 Tax=Polychaeton citri CBS 116435 TaxID=1314669 RepID=A0A9P4UJU4_9PEZI|nr:HCP-like protein [Polychaeton citri CBS 116435]
MAGRSENAPPRTPINPPEQLWPRQQHSPGRTVLPSPDRNKRLRGIDHPEVRLQETPASPVNISPPRPGIREAEVASIREASIRDHDSRRSSRNIPSPDSSTAAKLRSSAGASAESLPFRPRPGSGSVRIVRDRSPHSRASSGSYPRIEEEGHEHEFGGELHQAHEETPGLQYFAFEDSPRKKEKQRVQRASHAATASTGSSSSGENHSRHHRGLSVPHNAALPRPVSSYTLNTSEGRGRTLSPLSANSATNSPNGSPRIHARDISASRRSPASRPISYIDLLSSVPYNQQIAPGSGPMDNTDLQGIVGNAASLLDTKKTLEMYRANVKKTNQPDIQYEFAMFMINVAKTIGGDPSANSSGLDPEALFQEAKEILVRLSDRAYPFAQYYLGDGYFSGVFSSKKDNKPNYDKAFHLFLGASKHGHAEASYRAALCYEFGWGTGKSYPKAIQFHRQAASKGHPGAATRLALACLRGDMGLGGGGVRSKHYREGVKWLKRATESADFQYNSAPFELGQLHLTGYGDDIFKDEAYAAQLFTQSAELGHVEANFQMGQAYELGLYGCPRDAALSVHFYNGAASRDMPEAMMALCAWYMVGAEPVLERDEGEAYAWALRAAEMEFPKAEYAVGYFTEMGIGCRRDPLEANVWYVRAADKGNEVAKQRLDIIREAAMGGDAGIPMTKAEAKTRELGAGGKKKILGIF